MPRDIRPNGMEEKHLIEHRVEWEVRKPMTRSTLAQVLQVCEEALIPEHAKLRIVNWNNDEGFTVKASWPMVLQVEP